MRTSATKKRFVTSLLALALAGGATFGVAVPEASALGGGETYYFITCNFENDLEKSWHRRTNYRPDAFSLMEQCNAQGGRVLAQMH